MQKYFRIFVSGKRIVFALLIVSLATMYTPVLMSEANAAEDKKAAPKAAKAAPKEPAVPVIAPPKGDVVMESISQPIVRSRKISRYEHATIIIWLRSRDYAPLVCKNRYKLADAFLLDLHDHPISRKRLKEGRQEAEQRLFDIAAETFGPKVLKRLRVEWGRNPTGGKTTIFGTFTDVQCDTAS